MAPSRPSLPLAGTLLTLPLLLSACGGTVFGDALSRSFSRAPAATPRPATPATPPPTAATPARPVANEPTARPGANEPTARPPAAATPVTPVAPAVRPAPYRVTIRLPLADPSAPAEVVTKALRAAGVPFEVETIERMPSAGTPATETPAPVPATGSTAPATGSAAPTSRPAPAPR